MGRRNQPDDIKERRQYPRCDGYICYNRVQWVAVPRPIEQALEASRRWSMRADHCLDDLLQTIAESFRERLRRGRRRGFGHSVFSFYLPDYEPGAFAVLPGPKPANNSTKMLT